MTEQAASMVVTAALLVIGDEILSGRTKDKNIGYIADYLSALGIDLREARVVPDEEDDIVDAVNALRARYDYVFTTGGIGPTHDDITADAIAKAFGVSISEDPRALAMLAQWLKPEDLNESRRRMARIPKGAELVANAVSKAPGFWIGNVIVMAGVPAIMQSMMDVVAPQLRTGVKMLMRAIEAHQMPEGDYAAGLAAIAKAYPETVIGSYPSLHNGRFQNQIVVRCRDEAKLEQACAKIEAMLVALGTRKNASLPPA